MHRKSTFWLMGTAIALFLFIYFFERKLPNSVEASLPPKLLPALHTNEVTALEIRLGNSTNVIRAEKHEGWTLVKPSYPALDPAVTSFLEEMANLRAYDKLPPHEVVIQGAKNFGFEPARAKIEIDSGTNHYDLVVGSTTPLTNNVYVKLEPSGEVYVTDGSFVPNLPRSLYDWRSPSVVELENTPFNRMQVRTGQRLFELERNPTNKAWQITRPVPGRADQGSVEAFLQQLLASHVKSFVADSPTAELERYGLQNPPIELSFLQGTGQVYSVDFGISPTNMPARVYARLIGQSNIVTVDQKLADALVNPFKTFHDPHLLSFNPAELDRISIQSLENFVLQRQPDGSWTIGEKEGVRADPALMGLLTTNLAAIEILDIAREVPTDNDLKMFGLVKPVASFSLYERLTNRAGITTNILFSEVSFGTNKADTIYCKRSDESPVYITYLAQELNLPTRAFQMRDRRIWSFSPTNVASVTLTNTNGSNQLRRLPEGSWSKDPIANAAIGELIYRLGQLHTFNWVAKGESHMVPYGIAPGSPALRVILKDHKGAEDKLEVQFGKPSLDGHMYAAVLLPDESERVIFKFPGALYQQMLQSLPMPK
jgi:hypothetical protein